ncbi:MAG: isoleucine--tRNA ligase [Candidatus Hodarchaeaceae archaeon]|nr:isoleucine--tRNA ligase [Candidatus Hodarchaeaceae archaeon]
MIRPAAKVYDVKKNEREIQEWWESSNTYEKVKQLRAGAGPWYFLDGPPYASGAIHLGTAWNKIIKDAILRYKTMRGFNVLRQPGWDCHGLPIEVKVEEKLGIRTKKDIESKIGVERFIQSCKQWALDHVALMTEQFKRLGVWMDWDNPYVTFTNDYIEAAWWTLKRAYGRGLLRKDMRVIHWCPRCETALAEHEVRGEYYNVRDPSLFARFKLRDRPNEYLLIWTTTPWTLPADMAVCVHPELEYARVAVGDEVYILASPLVEKVMAELKIGEYRVLGSVKGKVLEGLPYEHPLLEEVPKQREYTQHHRVICGEHVTLEEGTGCVHTAPGHGEEDFVVGAGYGLPVFSPVGPDGRFTEEAGKYAGMFVKDADPVILDDMQRNGTLVKRAIIVHSYPHCWRCQTPLLFRATDQWFIRVKDIKPDILEKNAERVRWVPDWVATRYINGVESVGDWCISRQRYWGIPLPIWVCERCDSVTMVESMKELSSLSLKPVGDIDLHRPHVDRVELRCAKCGGTSKRVSDVLDVWFDSGIASWASLGYPKRSELFEKLWPSEFITEGEDQVTKWFYSQQVVSVVAFNEAPYKLVLMHGFVLDEHGRKMSKSLGNVVDPQEVIDKYGADGLRFYMLSACPPWEDLRFNWRGVETVNKMLNIIWNVHVFATTYMSLDEFDPNEINLELARANFQPEDLWLISRTNSVTRELTRVLDEFDLHRATRAIANFVLEDLSRWYIRLARERVWIEKEDPRKLAAHVALYQAMHTLVRLLAPFVPHISEVIYRDLVKAVYPGGPESVHMLPWPAVDESAIDGALEQGMNVVRAFVEAGAAARQKAKLKLRWPVRKAIVQTSTQKTILRGLGDLFRTQLNCKELVLLGPDERFEGLRVNVKIDEHRVREKLGGLAQQAVALLRKMDPPRLREELQRHGFIGLQVNGRKVSISSDMVAFEEEAPSGFVLVSTEFGKIAIDTKITPELKAECLARELVRRLQTMRKEMDLEMEERVDVTIGVGAEESLKLLATQQNYISREVRVRNLRLSCVEEVPGEGYLKDWNIDGDSFRLCVKRLSS